MTDDVPDDVRAFFTAFERAGADLDTAVLATLFADEFLNCDPNGAGVVTREAMLAALPMRERLFGSAGLGSARLAELTCEQLDERYVLARTTWTVPDRTNDTAVRLRSSFLLRSSETGPQIVLYLNHHDIGALVSAHKQAAG